MPHRPPLKTDTGKPPVAASGMARLRSGSHAGSIPRSPGGPATFGANSVLGLQRLAGNAAVSRLVQSGQEQPGAAGATTGAATSGDSSAAVAASRAAFGRMAQAALGIRDPAARRAEMGRRRDEVQGRASARAGEQQEANGQTEDAAAEVSRVLASARQAPVLGPAVQPAREPADKIPADQRPGAVAEQAAAHRVVPDGLVIPMDEAAGRGPESDRAMDQLRGFGDTHPRLVRLGAAISDRIAGLRERSVRNAQQASDELRGTAADQRALVQDATQSSHETVSQQLRATRTQIMENAADARGGVDKHADDARAQSDTISTAQQARLDSTIADGRLQAWEIFSGARVEVGAAGDTQGRRASDHSGQLADRALELGREEADNQRRTEEDKDLADRKADAVLEVAQDYAGQLRDDGNDVASQIADQAAEAKDQVSTEEDPTIDGLGNMAGGAADGIRSLMTSVRSGIGPIVSQGHQQLGGAQTSVLGEVDNLEQAAQGRAEALAAEGEASVDAGLAAGLVAHANITGQAGQLLDEAGRDAIAMLSDVASQATSASAGPVVSRQVAGTAPQTTAAPAADADGPDGSAVAQLDEVGPGLDASAAALQGELTGSLVNAATGAQQAAGAWTAENDDVTGRLGATARAGLNEIAGAAGSQVDALVTDGGTQAANQVDRVAGDVDHTIGGLRGDVQTGVGQAVDKLRTSADAGVQQADGQIAEVPGAMRDAAEAQESWLGRLGSWVSHQLSDTWKAIKGMADWRFVASLVVGIGVAFAVGLGVALLIASAPFTLPGLAVVLIAGAAAGAAGFAAAQVTGNLLDPNPNRHWYDGVGHAAILGLFVGAAGAAATFAGLSLAAGALAVMGAAGVGTVVANLATGRNWDDHLVANILILGIFHGVIKAIADRIPSLSTEKDPSETGETTEYKPPPGTTPEVVIDDPARIQVTDFKKTNGTYKCQFLDDQTGASFGYAELEADQAGNPQGGPHLTIDPTNAQMPDGSPVRLTASGFSWTVESLRAVIDAFRRQFGRGPSDMGGLLAWKNLLNFQQEFAEIRAENPGLDEGVVAERAARAISFGQHRIAIGYGDISVQYGNMGDVTTPDGQVLQNVPRWVEVQARPTTPGVIPTVPTKRDDDEE
jgi:hypothetical protein